MKTKGALITLLGCILACSACEQKVTTESPSTSPHKRDTTYRVIDTSTPESEAYNDSIMDLASSIFTKAKYDAERHDQLAKEDGNFYVREFTEKLAKDAEGGLRYARDFETHVKAGTKFGKSGPLK